MICNEKESMCFAGVFGGLESGVSNTTSSIFLESAISIQLVLGKLQRDII